PARPRGLQVVRRRPGQPRTDRGGGADTRNGPAHRPTAGAAHAYRAGDRAQHPRRLGDPPIRRDTPPNPAPSLTPHGMNAGAASSLAYRVQRLLPGVVIKQAAAGAWRMGFELARSEQDTYTRLAELVNAAGKHRVGSEPLVDERKHNDPHTQPGQFCQL